MKYVLKLYGLGCNACALKIEKELKKIKEIRNVNVNFALSEAYFEIIMGNKDLIIKKILSAIENLGYKAELKDDEKNNSINENDKEFKVLKLKVILSILLTIPLIIDMAFMLLNYEHINIFHNKILHLILATIVQFFIGYEFYLKGFRNLSMDTLIAIGTGVAYFYSLGNVILFKDHRNVYFETSTMIITLVLFGKYLEQKTKGKISLAIKNLMKLSPQKCILIKEGREIEIATDEIKPGDRIKIKPGDRIGIDGIIEEGTTTIDESMLTGESIPVVKTVNEFVNAGTINLDGSIIVKAINTGKGTVLNRIIKIIEEAQREKAPIQNLADRISSIFVPVIIIVAFITFMIWFFFRGDLAKAIISSISVLVIACPCALGLAIPTAIMAGVSRGAELGILIKNAMSIEKTVKINTIIFDKTGTLTEGKLTVERIISCGNIETDKLLFYIASVESLSNHPVAKGIIEYAKEKMIDLLKPSEFKYYPGKGIIAKLDDNDIIVGNKLFILENHINIPEDIDLIIKQNNNCISLLIAISKKLEGIAFLRDKAKEEAKDVITKLKNNFEIFLISGDNKDSVMNLAKDLQINIENVFYNVLPDKKLEIVKKIKDEKKNYVAMIGDGINDVPALVSSDLGIAMGNGTDIAIDSADVVILKGDIKRILILFQFTKKIFKIIRQNLFWAFFYNIICIPVAALGLLNPIIASIAMSFSSISVVMNSIRLTVWKAR